MKKYQNFTERLNLDGFILFLRLRGYSLFLQHMLQRITLNSIFKLCSDLNGKIKTEFQIMVMLARRKVGLKPNVILLNNIEFSLRPEKLETLIL